MYFLSYYPITSVILFYLCTVQEECYSIGSIERFIQSKLNGWEVTSICKTVPISRTIFPRTSFSRYWKRYQKKKEWMD